MASQPDLHLAPLDYQQLGAAFQASRAAAAVIGVVAFSVLAVAWSWPVGWVVVAVASGPTIDALVRRRRPGDSPIWSLTMDVTAVTAIVAIIAPPPAMALPALAYLVTAAGTFLAGRQAMAVAAASVVAVGLAVALRGGGSWDIVERLVLVGVAVAVFVPILAMLVSSVGMAAAGRQALTEVLDRRLRYQRALTRCSSILLSSGGDEALEEAVGVLLAATDCRSVFVEANVDDPVRGLCSHVVCDVGTEEGLYDPDYWDMTPWSKMPAARARLSAGQAFPFRVEDLEGEERELYEGSAIGSELDIPVLVAGEWAGLIGFSDRDPRRTWDDEEVDLLRTVAEMVGAFWERQRSHRRLEELVRSKDEFVASVSHELRSPLTAVVGLAQELASGDGFSPEETVELHRLIAEQSTEVAHIVEDLLVAARVDIDAVSILPVVVELGDQVRQVLASVPAGPRRIEVGEVNVTALADPVRVRQVLRNLVTNGVRYGGTRIIIDADCDAVTTRIRVSDDGPRIPSEHRERIFDSYYRANPVGGQPASVGLGLYVSRRLARLMGGDLTYRWEGGWSVFELTLPTGAQAGEVIVLEPSSTSSPAPLTPLASEQATRGRRPIQGGGRRFPIG
ncbi:MAG: GAF domain-containing sensor histidine kinase [Acidimicrobiia bacterium]